MPRCKNPAHKKGEIWWFSDPMEWDEPTGILHGRRPYVVISANSKNSTVIVAPITSATDGKLYPNQLITSYGKVRCEQARVVDKGKLHSYVANLSNEEYQRLDKALIALFNINTKREDNNA